MPRARRRRRRGTPRSVRLVLEALAIAVAAVVVIGSISKISSESSAYRTSTDAGYGELASRVVDDSNGTGGRLASLMARAPGLPNQEAPYVAAARTQVQQGLDQAVLASGQEADAAADLVPPDPLGNVSGQLVQVMDDRATAVSDLRTAVDQRLGMAPLPVAGATAGSSTPGTVPLVSIDQAARSMTAAGALFNARTPSTPRCSHPSVTNGSRSASPPRSGSRPRTRTRPSARSRSGARPPRSPPPRRSLPSTSC